MSPSKILVVDDDPLILRLLIAWLKKIRPYDNIIAATTCKTALMLLASENFSYVISDYNLPDGTGKSILCNSSPNSIRIGISGSHQDKDFESCCDQFLSKPFGFAEIKSLFDAQVHEITISNESFQKDNFSQ